VHTTLWARKIYSTDLFTRTKYCSFTARRSRHPKLNAYISETIYRLKVYRLHAKRLVQGTLGDVS